MQMFAAAGVRYAGADFVFISFFSFMTSCVLRPVCLKADMISYSCRKFKLCGGIYLLLVYKCIWLAVNNGTPTAQNQLHAGLNAARAGRAQQSGAGKRVPRFAARARDR